MRLATVFPLVLAPLGVALFVLAVGGRQEFQSLWEAAPGAYALAGLGLFSTLTLALAFFLASRRPIPLVIFAGLASLPWLASVLFSIREIHEMGDVLASVNPDMVMTIISTGLGEQFGSHAIGAWTSAVLWVACALGWAWAGRKADNRGLFTAAALLLAGGLYGFARAMETLGFSSGLTAAGTVSAADLKTLLFAVGLETIGTWHVASTVALLLLVLAFLGHAGWHLTRPEGQRGLPGLAMLAAVLVLVVAVDAQPLREGVRVARQYSHQSPTQWAGLEPLVLPGADHPFWPIGALSPEGFQSTEGVRVAWGAGEEALARAFEKGDKERGFSFVVDARLDGARMQELVKASARAGAQRLQLIGEGRSMRTPERQALLAQVHPLLKLVGLNETVAVNMGLASTLEAPVDSVGRFEGEDMLRVTSRENPDSSRLISLKAADPTPTEEPHETVRVLILLDEHSSARVIAHAASALEPLGMELVLSTQGGEAPPGQPGALETSTP